MANCAAMDTPALLQFLDHLAVRYKRHEHVAVYTSEQARRLISPLPGASAKNLFLRDQKGGRHFLLAFDDAKALDLKALAEELGVTKLSLASAERLKARLGVEPGAVSLMALVNDAEHQVEVVIDKDIWQAEALQCHPLVNTATLVISLEDIKKFLEATGHAVRVVTIDARASPAGSGRESA
jgi:Ala-tRNA(Pro) deacylase